MLAYLAQVTGQSIRSLKVVKLLEYAEAEAISQQSERLDVFGNMTHLPFPGGKYLRVPLTIAGSWYYRLLERLGL